MLGRILFTGTFLINLPACSLLAPFQSDAHREGYFESRTVADQDPYWRRFYELEQEIAKLKASNARLQQQVEPVDPVFTAAASQPEVSVQDNSVVEDVLSRVRHQADRAIAAIDRAMTALADTGTLPKSELNPVASAQVNIPDIQGNLIRNDEGEVVRQTTYSEARKARYNYSVVYVYPEPQLWNDMWDKLEAAQERDKWRGVNPDRSRYFIYVGAYYNQLDAEQRQEALFSLVGERPDMRERVQNHALAAK